MGKFHIYNTGLCAIFPFLYCDSEYKTTWLDYVPLGWREKFLEMCDALAPWRNKFEILQIKEKYGQLRVYIWTDDEVDVGGEIYDQVKKVVDSFCKETAHICMKCGSTLEVKDCLCKTCRKWG